MPTTALLGATGALGRRVAARLADDGHELVLVARDRGRLADLANDLGERVAAVHPVPSDADERRLVDALGDADLAVSALPVTGGVAGRALDAALRGAVHLVDAVDVTSHLVRAYDELDVPARERGTIVVPGIGWRTAIGDLLAAVAATRVGEPLDVHVAAVVPDRGGVVGTASPGVRAGIAASLGEPVTAYVRGERAEELPGETRRLAWFPRPFGPHHAAAVPGLEPLSVPRHLTQVRTVRSYVAISSPRAELLQATANLARHGTVRRWLASRLTRPGRGTGGGARWAVVAEVAGPDGGLARAWANGSDHLEVSARLVAAVAAAVRGGEAPAGVLAPAQVAAPRDLLDALSARTEVRWSVANPRSR